jgi:hypothetical protein
MGKDQLRTIHRNEQGIAEVLLRRMGIDVSRAHTHSLCTVLEVAPTGIRIQHRGLGCGWRGLILGLGEFMRLPGQRRWAVYFVRHPRACAAAVTFAGPRWIR